MSTQNLCSLQTMKEIDCTYDKITHRAQSPTLATKAMTLDNESVQLMSNSKIIIQNGRLTATIVSALLQNSNSYSIVFPGHNTLLLV